ncbi:MAG: Glu/Leu/Phe/Val dehydrogenase dimerization domain-containing protein [Desulfocapsaceae bacterium]|nr:Glu/Leu/Phe/Val dehydrogenase dimerization domain-containing protein [Desulfocapsaceae bacterium]
MITKFANKYSELDCEGYERVVRCDNTELGFTAMVAVHDSTLGPALGGCRVWGYGSDDEALTDVLRLSEGMTYKNALAGLQLGGGKSVIRTDLNKVDSRAMFASFGQFIEYLGGLYITAEDVNSTLADMEVVKEQTNYVATVGASGNPSPFTAYGVYCGIVAGVEYRLNTKNLQGLTVAVQGVGQTGARLVERLAEEGCKIIVADINTENIAQLRMKVVFKEVKPAEIYDVPCDIFAPCAMGGILNEETIPRLRCSMVAGSANNQLLKEEDGEALRRREILYAPDFAINAGGVINISCEIGRDYNAEVAWKKTETIAGCLRKIFARSAELDLPTNVVAVQMAEEILGRKTNNSRKMFNVA